MEMYVLDLILSFAIYKLTQSSRQTLHTWNITLFMMTNRAMWESIETRVMLEIIVNS
jgi:hypothetical protein